MADWSCSGLEFSHYVIDVWRWCASVKGRDLLSPKMPDVSFFVIADRFGFSPGNILKLPLGSAPRSPFAQP